MMKSHRNCGLVVLLFFLIYAGSPLTYNLTEGRHSAASALGTAAHSFSNVTLYLLEALYAAIARSDDDDQDQGLPSKHILISKKWAIHRGNNDILYRSAHTVNHLSEALNIRRMFTVIASIIDLDQYWPKKSDEYRPLASGLSPPFLS